MKTLRDHLISAFVERASPDTIETAEREADEFLETMCWRKQKVWMEALEDEFSEHEWMVVYDADRQDFYLLDIMDELEEDDL